MDQYFGVIEIKEITNLQNGSTATFIPLDETHVKFVHYPDCQQLIIWLTQPGRDYTNMRLVDTKNEKIIEEFPVTDKLNGSIQLLWDTLTIAPGEYKISIDWKDGWQHRIDLKKYEADILPPVKPTIVETPGPVHEPIVYKDGFGNALIDEDLVLREKAKKIIKGKFTRHLEYDGNVRAGTVIYIENETRIEFYNEMGGGNCMVYLDVPTAQQWEAATKTPLGSREEILEFVARTVQQEQASNCRYVIGESTISFYYK